MPAETISKDIIIITVNENIVFTITSTIRFAIKVVIVNNVIDIHALAQKPFESIDFKIFFFRLVSIIYHNCIDIDFFLDIKFIIDSHNFFRLVISLFLYLYFFYFLIFNNSF